MGQATHPIVLFLKGGKGSGNFGHPGRPGKVGGSGDVAVLKAPAKEKARIGLGLDTADAAAAGHPAHTGLYISLGQLLSALKGDNARHLPVAMKAAPNNNGPLHKSEPFLTAFPGLNSPHGAGLLPPVPTRAATVAARHHPPEGGGCTDKLTRLMALFKAYGYPGEAPVPLAPAPDPARIEADYQNMLVCLRRLDQGPQRHQTHDHRS